MPVKWTELNSVNQYQPIFEKNLIISQTNPFNCGFRIKLGIMNYERALLPDTLSALSEVEGKQAIHVSFFLISDV